MPCFPSPMRCCSLLCLPVRRHLFVRARGSSSDGAMPRRRCCCRSFSSPRATIRPIPPVRPGPLLAPPSGPSLFCFNPPGCLSLPSWPACCSPTRTERSPLGAVGAQPRPARPLFLSGLRLPLSRTAAPPSSPAAVARRPLSTPPFGSPWLSSAPPPSRAAASMPPCLVRPRCRGPVERWRSWLPL